MNEPNLTLDSVIADFTRRAGPEEIEQHEAAMLDEARSEIARICEEVNGTKVDTVIMDERWEEGNNIEGAATWEEDNISEDDEPRFWPTLMTEVDIFLNDNYRDVDIDSVTKCQMWEETDRFQAFMAVEKAKAPAPYVDPDTAASFIVEAGATIGNRAASRDVTSERSMARCVEAFNAMTDCCLTEEDGWYFMMCLKEARARGGAYRRDDYVDQVGYAALRAECAAKNS